MILLQKVHFKMVHNQLRKFHTKGYTMVLYSFNLKKNCEKLGHLQNIDCMFEVIILQPWIIIISYKLFTLNAK